MTHRPYTPPALRRHGPVEARTAGGIDPALLDPALIQPVAAHPWLAVLFLFALLFGGNAAQGGGTARAAFDFS